jgi:hypothetical protein
LPPLPAGAASAQTPARQLLGESLKYIPQGCPITVSISADESQPSWFQDAPEIRGQVTLSNPTQYDVPISSVIVQASSSNGQLYSTTAWCDNGRSTVVPYNPQAYTYGTATCRYRLVLDRNVFGTYGQHGSRRLMSNGGVQANFFPGSSSGSSSSSGSGGGYGYFPPPSQRPSWTVTGIATVSYSNAQCLSAPTPVDTDCWWDWLASWYNRHHHSWWSSLFGGRRLLSNTKPVDPQTPSKVETLSSEQRKLMSAPAIPGSSSGASEWSAATSGGSVQGSRASAQHFEGSSERNGNTYYNQKPYKLVSRHSSAWLTSTGPVEDSSHYSSGDDSGSKLLSSDLGAALGKRFPLAPGGVWHFNQPDHGRQDHITDEDTSRYSSGDDDSSRKLLSSGRGDSYAKAHAYVETPPPWVFKPPPEVYDVRALSTNE